MMTLLRADDRKRIEQAIRDAEAQTQVEIVFAESPCSGDYTRWLVLPTWLALLAVALLLHLVWPSLATVWILVAQLPVGVFLWWLVNRPSIALRLIPDHAEIEAVRSQTLRLFAEKGLFETAARTGVLVHLSDYERRVEILADRGLDAHVDAQAWQAHVASITEAIRAGRAVDGICEAIERIGVAAAALGTPGSPRNELPDLA